MGLIYSILIVLAIWLAFKTWKFVERKFSELDRDEKMKVVADKMEDLETKEQAANKIDAFNKEHASAHDAGSKIDKFLDDSPKEEEDKDNKDKKDI